MRRYKDQTLIKQTIQEAKTAASSYEPTAQLDEAGTFLNWLDGRLHYWFLSLTESEMRDEAFYGCGVDIHHVNYSIPGSVVFHFGDRSYTSVQRGGLSNTAVANPLDYMRNFLTETRTRFIDVLLRQDGVNAQALIHEYIALHSGLRGFVTRVDSEGQGWRVVLTLPDGSMITIDVAHS